MLQFLKKYRNKFQLKNFYRNLIVERNLCFDIGANVGSKSKTMLSLGARVIAFEPQSSCVKSLEKIKSKRFQFFSFGVGSKNEIMELNLANHSEVATLSQQFIDFFETETVRWSEKESVEVKTLDSLIVQYGVPNFCKIDVEGFEWQILSALNYSIPIIEFEFTSGFIPETQKIINLFKAENSKFNFTLNEKPRFECENWISASELLEIINFLPREKLHGNIFVKSKATQINCKNE